MPTYEYTCDKCDIFWDKFLTFAEFDQKPNVKCPKCDKKSRLSYETTPHCHVVNVNTVGLYAERNTVKIGKTKIDEIEGKQKEHEEKNKKPVKGRWWGKLDVKKQKELLKDNSKETIRKRQKFIQEGE